VLRRRGLFDPAAVQRLIQLDRNGRVDGTYTIFCLICIEVWCRLFVDNDVPIVTPAVAASAHVT
jgi:asparagine synthase (glutamine-hydrolysing)